MNSEQDSLRLVVGVGASAGGLEAFRELLSALPDDSGMTFLLVQHLDPTHRSMLTELLKPSTKMEVREARQGDKLKANTLFIIQPDTALAVQEGRIELTTPTLHRGVRLPVDHLFRSLAKEYGSRAVGVMLSGAGSDGSDGLRDIKTAGGLTIAQKPELSRQPGMPQSAVDTGMVDLVLAIDQIPEALERFASLPPGAHEEPSLDREESGAARTAQASRGTPPLPALSEEQLHRLTAVLAVQLDFDLKVYKRATVERRVLRRMVLSGFKDVEAYLSHVRAEPGEQQMLMRDLLIGVTEFFRDTSAFQCLRENVIDPLVLKAAAEKRPVRVWVPGCATGEEVYSIGIEILESAEVQGKRPTVQIFATDMDSEALATGRQGIYPPSIAEQVSERRLRTYFTPMDGRGYQVGRQLRDLVFFAMHDLTKDPPFSKMDLVSCRNVLIYLTTEAQAHVLKVIHFGLRQDGHLFLSTSESTGPQRKLFTTISKSNRIYRKHGISRPITVRRSRPYHLGSNEEKSKEEAGRDGGGARRSQRPAEAESARQTMLNAWAPPSVVISGDNRILFLHGELGPYLRFPQGGNPQLELSSLIRPEIATRARGALYKCRREDRKVSVLSSPDEGVERIRMTAQPARDLGEEAVVLTFETVASSLPAEAPSEPESPAQEALIKQLEKELHATREDLRSTVEELETSNEELRSSNEESMSMNEELQSANEELEATTEELRSLNEELTTVNSQLRDKIELLEQAHNDLNNFFSSTNVATLFLDERLRIKRFTPAAARLLGIDHGDLGRRVTDIARDLLQLDLATESRTVLDNLTPQSREMHLEDGRWISRTVLPYRTETRHIEGVVVSFSDITVPKRSTHLLKNRERQQAVIAQLGVEALREINLQAFLNRTVRDVQQTLDTDFCKILEVQPSSDKLLLRAGVGWEVDPNAVVAVDRGMQSSQAGYTLRSSGVVIVEDLATEKRFSGPPLLMDHGVVSGLSVVIRHGEREYGVIGVHTRERREFTRDDANFLQAASTVIGLALRHYQNRLRLTLVAAINHVLGEAEALEGTFTELFSCFHRELDTLVGELWWPSEDGGHLELRMLDTAPDSDRELIAERFSNGASRDGEGLIGTVFRTGKAAWCSDLSNTEAFSRLDCAREMGIQVGIAFPILQGNERLGVMAVFSCQRTYIDEDLLRTLEGIGRSVGDVVGRIESERRAMRMAAITEASQDAIICYDADRRVTVWLPGAEALFGYTAEEMVGSSIERIVPAGRRAELRKVQAAIMQGEKVEPYETERRTKSGRTIQVSIRSTPIRDTYGNVVGVSSTDRDVSRLKETERRLLEADRQKDEFLAMLGHELRNPLSAIRSAAELFKLLASDDERLQKAQAILERQTTHMAKLLDGLLDVSRIIRGKIRLDRRLVDFASICREVLSDAANRIPGRSLELSGEIPDEPVWVLADRIRLTQIVDNLLANAVKYTNDGGSFTLALTPLTEEEKVVLEVRDTGIGIEPELLPYIFDVFRQSRQSLDRARGGLGLGLALVKSLVELHGGEVEARSRGKGHGATIVVRLPMAEAPAEARPSRGPAPVHGRQLRVLVIEDNEDSAIALQQVLELTGYTVRLAHDGPRGVELAGEMQPDVILCDIGLPGGMSGFQVASKLRGIEELNGVILIAISGYGRPEDKRESREAGFDLHLTKPVDVTALEEVLNEQIAKRRRAGS